MHNKKDKICLEYHNDTQCDFIPCDKDPRDDGAKKFQHLDSTIITKRNRSMYKQKDLQKMIQRHKIDRIITTVTKKCRLNSVFRQPCELEQKKQKKNELFPQKLQQLLDRCKQAKGLQLNNIALIIWSIINILQITLMVFIYSVMVAFPQIEDIQNLFYLNIISIVLFTTDVVLNLVVKRYQNGKYLEQVGDISVHYFKRGFAIDLISILVFPIDLLVQKEPILSLFIVILAVLKLRSNIFKFEKLEYLMINSVGKEHYYGLIKVFMTNFVIGHILSILVNLMAPINHQINWQIKIGISQEVWFIKYIWGYYWGTNMMLTVGFGDISATNYYQAIMLVFIQTFSCITLAYNINYVGALISSMRRREEEKKKKLKFFHRMCQQNFVSNELESKVACHIEEQYRIKQSFEFQAHDEVLKALPKKLQVEFRKQANKTLFDNIGFLNNLSKKNLYKLAEIITRKICYPEEIIVDKGCVSHFTILQKGSLTFNCRVRSNLDGFEIEQIDIKENQKPKIISLNFIKNKVVNYIVKSKGYSILYYLTREEVIESLRSSEMDFQMFCQLKDKNQNGIDQNNLYPCSICKVDYHNKFECSRLHFIPLKRNIILKFIYHENNIKQKRQFGFTRNKLIEKPYFNRSYLQDEQKRFVELNFDEDHCREIQKIMNFYCQLESSKIMQDKKNVLSQTRNIFRSNSKGVLSLMNQKAMIKLEEILENKNKMESIWDLEIDQAENFNFYFREGNPEEFRRQKCKAKKARKLKSFNTLTH